MNQSSILLSPDAMKLFTDEFKLPITVHNATYFKMRLTTLDNQFGCKDNFKLFTDIMSQYKNIGEYENARYEQIVFLRSLPSMRAVSQAVNNITLYDLCEPEDGFGFPDKDIYQNSNDGKHFMRVKFKDADFSLLHYVCPDSFQEDEDTYENFLNKVGCPAAWIASPKFREDFFEYLHRALMMIRIAFLIKIDKLLRQTGEFELYCIEEDALVYSLPKLSFNILKLKSLMDCNLGSLFKISVFDLHVLKGYGYGGSDAWQEERTFPFGNPRRADFVNVNPNLYHILMLYYQNEFIFKNDLVINADGMLATLNETPVNPFT